MGKMPIISCWLERWVEGVGSAVRVSSHTVQGTSDPTARGTGQCDRACLQGGVPAGRVDTVQVGFPPRRGFAQVVRWGLL